MVWFNNLINQAWCLPTLAIEYKTCLWVEIKLKKVVISYDTL